MSARTPVDWIDRLVNLLLILLLVAVFVAMIVVR